MSPSRHWTSFVSDARAEPSRGLHETGDPRHRLRVGHHGSTLLVHLSDEDGNGLRVLAVGRESRESRESRDWSVAQGRHQKDTAVLVRRELRARDV